MKRVIDWRLGMLAGVSAAALMTSTGAWAQSSDIGEIQEQSQAESQLEDQPVAADDAEAGTDIIVRGVRASLLRSIDTKRDASTIVDAISAEELGKFPDRNVAEALANIPGVTVGRDGRGEGRNITVRGLGQNFAITTLNGRILPTDGADRSFAFDVLPSEVIAGAEIQKAVQSTELEGSIGGNVDLRTARPFDNPGFHASGSVEGQYRDLADKFGFKASGVVSTTFADDTMGILISGTYNKYKFRTDNLGEYSSTDTFDVIDGPDGREAVQVDSGGVIVPYFASTGYVLGERERWGGSAAFQWKPADTVEIRLDGIYSNYSVQQSNYRVSVGLTPFDDDGNLRWDLDDVVIDENGVVTNYTVQPATVDVLTSDEPRNSETYQFGGHIDWEAGDRLKFSLDGYYGKATDGTGGQNRFVVAGIPNSRAVVSTRDEGIPDIAITIPNADGTVTDRPLSSAGNDDLYVHYIGIQGQDITDETWGVQLDTVYEVDNEVFKSIAFGGAYTNRRKTVETIDNQYTTSCNFCGYPFTFGDFGADVVRSPQVSNILDKLDGNFPRNFPYFDIDTYLSSLPNAENNPNAVDGDGNEYPTGYATQIVAYNPLASYDIKERTWAGYVQFNLEGERWRADIGARLVDTKVDSIGFGATVRSYVVFGAGSADVDFNEIGPIPGGGDYTRLLPSANFAYDITDALRVRLAASQAISRPTFGELSSAKDYSAAQSNTPVITNAGNPNLKPVSADQADISFEYNPNRRLSLSAAAFYKHLTGFVTTRAVPFTLVPTDQPADEPQSFQFTEVIFINGDSADVYGVEVGGQYFLDNGLGFQANATYNKSEATREGRTSDLPDAVPFSANAKIFYNNYGFDASVSYQYQSRFTSSLFSYIDSLAVETDPYHELAASIAYDITPNLTVYAQGSNLLGSDTRSYSTYRNVPAFYEYSGRNFFFGVRARL